MPGNQLCAFLHQSLRIDSRNPAMTAGVAVEATSNAQTSMGITMSNFDGDRRIDFCATGTLAEHDALHQKSLHGLWIDRIATPALVRPALGRMGLGSTGVTGSPSPSTPRRSRTLLLGESRRPSGYGYRKGDHPPLGKRKGAIHRATRYQLMLPHHGGPNTAHTIVDNHHAMRPRPGCYFARL